MVKLHNRYVSGILLLCVTLHAQIIIGKPRKDPASTPTSNPCAQTEPVYANLELITDRHLYGRITTSDGKPLRNARIELRVYLSQTSQRTVSVVKTDSDGHFNFGQQQMGTYRLLASPTRRYQQPADLICKDDSATDQATASNCELEIELQRAALPTDLLNCPVN